MGRGRGRNLGGENKDHSERKVVKEAAGKKDNPTRKERSNEEGVACWWDEDEGGDEL